jgi:hypothetical protein
MSDYNCSARIVEPRSRSRAYCLMTPQSFPKACCRNSLSRNILLEIGKDSDSVPAITCRPIAPPFALLRPIYNGIFTDTQWFRAAQCRLPRQVYKGTALAPCARRQGLQPPPPRPLPRLRTISWNSPGALTLKIATVQ